MTGAELRAYRKAIGLTQKALAQRANISCSAVKYWERKAQINPNCVTVKRMAMALGIGGLMILPPQYARTGGWGLSEREQMEEKFDAEVELKMAAWRARAALRAAKLRVLCGAKTRKDAPCRNMSEPGRKRCKFHGGKSTGPKSCEGRAKIAEAQRARWAKWYQTKFLADTSKGHSP